MSEPAVSMPGFAGIVIETGVNDNAAPAAAQVHNTNTAGMSATQAAAARWSDSHSAEIAKGTQNAFLLKQYREATQHAFGSAPAPAWLQTEDAATALADAGAHVVQDGDVPEFIKALEPLTDQDAEQLVTRGVVAASLPREIASEVVNFGREAQLPKSTVTAILDRLGAHADKGGGLGEVPAEDVPALAERCAKLLGGYEKAEREIELARKFLHSIGGDALLARVDQRSGTLGFAPDLILQFSYLARTRGLDK